MSPELNVLFLFGKGKERGTVPPVKHGPLAVHIQLEAAGESESF